MIRPLIVSYIILLSVVKKGHKNKSLLELTQPVLKLPGPPFMGKRINTAVKIMAVLIYLLIPCTTII